MTDLVARLRRFLADENADDMGELCQLASEAADEIERLQRELDERTESANIKMFDQRAEIERLRADLEIWRRNGGDVLQAAEIERLQSELRSAHVDAELKAQRLRAEIERLRAELSAARVGIGALQATVERLRSDLARLQPI